MDHYDFIVSDWFINIEVKVGQVQYLQGQRLLVLGLGISGLSMARWCVRCGAVVRVADTRENPPGLKALRELSPDVEFISGVFDASRLLAPMEDGSVTGVLRSPGLFAQEPALKALLEAAQEQGIVVRCELDLLTEALAQIDEDVRLTQQMELAQAQENFEATVVLSDSDVFSLSDDAEVAQQEIGSDAQTDLEDESVVPFIPQPVVVTGYQPKIIAITGTNGKTTVTSLTAQLVERAGKSVVVAGNIGPAMLDVLSQKLDIDELPEVWVLELSSFQLDGVHHFNPSVATILNLTQDHLDWHGSMAHYVAAKGRIFGDQMATRVLNRNDEGVMHFVPSPKEIGTDVQDGLKRRGRISAKAAKAAAQAALDATPAYVTFGVDAPKAVGDFGIVQDGGVAWLAQAIAADETLIDDVPFSMRLLMPVDALRIRGRHNAANALAALALANSIGCDIAAMLFGLREYRGEPHRVASVAIVNGVEYFDDSKGTNVGATVAALAGLGVDHRIVVILGGDGKGQDFSPLLPLIEQHARAVVLIGRDGPLIEIVLKDAGVPMLYAVSMFEAVQLSAQQAHSGDVVLMSPACASLDMFENYGHRAKVFVEAVHALAQDQGQVMGGGL